MRRFVRTIIESAVGLFWLLFAVVFMVVAGPFLLIFLWAFHETPEEEAARLKSEYYQRW